MAISLVACFYALYLVGFFISHGVVSFEVLRQPIVVGVLLSSVALIALSGFFKFGMVALLATMLLVRIAPLMRQWQCLVFGILVPCVGVLLDVILGKEFDFTTIVVYGIVNTLAILMSYRIISERQAKTESEQLVRELKATQVLLSATTKRDERLRISRDLHDLVGHQLTALSLQLEVASHVSDSQKGEHLIQAKKISGSLLTSLRETVSEIRDIKGLGLVAALDALVHDIPGLDVQLNVRLDESVVDARQAEVIFRCVQEAMTNAIKHGNASRCQIVLSNDDETLSISILDNGIGSGKVVPGNGLKGMAERVAELDGELHASMTPDGFAVEVKLPRSLDG